MGNCGSSCCKGRQPVPAVHANWPADTLIFSGRSKDGLYEPALADSERDAVADLLGYLENVCDIASLEHGFILLIGRSGAKRTSSLESHFGH